MMDAPADKSFIPYPRLPAWIQNEEQARNLSVYVQEWIKWAASAGKEPDLFAFTRIKKSVDRSIQFNKNREAALKRTRVEVQQPQMPEPGQEEQK